MQGIGRASTAKMWLVGTAIGFGAFGGENVLPLEVAVHHDDGGSVPVNVADNDGHGGQPRQLTGVFAAVASN